MRVVHVANAYTPRSGGIRTTVHALGHGYRAAGHELVLVVPGPRAGDEELPWGRRITLAGPTVPGSGGYRILVDLRRVRALLDALAPDRLEVSDRLTLRGLGRWASASGVPSAVIAHERLDGVLRAFTPLGVRGAQLAADRHNATTAERFDSVVTTTRFAAQEFARIGIHTEYVPLGVDLEQFRPVSRTRGDIPLLVLCSRLSREKRPDLAVEALRVMLRGGFAARLVVAGSGPLTASLRRRARGLPVQFVGHLADRSSVAALLGAADVVLAPGPVETLGSPPSRPWRAALPSWRRARPRWPSSWRATPVAAQDPNRPRWQPRLRHCSPCRRRGGVERPGRGPSRFPGPARRRRCLPSTASRRRQRPPQPQTRRSRGAR